MLSATIHHIGLSTHEVSERISRDGYNELSSQKKKSIGVLFISVLSEPMLFLLLGTGILYVLLGESKDAIMLLLTACIMIGITVIQEYKTERTLEALKDLSSPRALVIRNGKQERIAGREVVRDDTILLREGDRVPADAYVLSQENLSVDESLLTGESVPVHKSVWSSGDTLTHPGGDYSPFVFAGSLVVGGHGIAKVVHTGQSTEMGKIGHAISTVQEEQTLLKKETNEIVRFAAVFGGLLCVIVAVIYIATRGKIIEGLLAGLTLGMAILPEEFPVVLLVFMTLGAWRISKRRVLTRNASAIETLGAATVLCVDKTGTLTENTMTLQTISAKGIDLDIRSAHPASVTEPFHRLLEYSVLASQADPYDPIEKEIQLIGGKFLSGTEHIHSDWEIKREYPLSKALMAISHVWQSPDRTEFVVASKGAPESIAELCHMSKAQRRTLQKRVDLLSSQGLRILGVASASFSKKELPKSQHDFRFEFAGLLGFLDPVRKSVPSSIQTAYEAGLRVIMITGDYPGTATWIAKSAGLQHPEHVLLGTDIATLSPGELEKRVGSFNVFARILPEQKLAIVRALKAHGDIVAMTGDGINDAPALKAAHIGIAMGERGTDVAREASDIVLLKDDFMSIVAAVRLGRRIYDNLKHAMGFVIAVHIPIIGLSLLLPLFHLPIVLFPAHIALLEFIIDPACSTVYEAEPEDPAVMKRPPRSLRERLLDQKTLGMSILQGFGVFVSVMALFLYVLSQGKPEAEARTMAFSVLILANLLLVTANLSWRLNLLEIIKRENTALWILICGAVVALGLILYIPPVRTLFHFSYLHLDDLALVAFAAGTSILWFEGAKRLKLIRT